MKLNKTLINKVLKASDGVIGTSNVYEFRSDVFRLRVSREQVDSITSAVAAKAVEGTIGITDFRGHEVFLPLDLKKYLGFTSKDQARPLLCAVNFTKDEIHATDSYRLLVGANHGGIVGIYDAFALELAALVDDDGRGYAESDGGEMQFGSIVPSDGHVSVYPVSGEYPNVKALLVDGETEQLTVDLPRSVANRNSHISKDVLATFFRDQLLFSSSKGTGSEMELLGSVSQNSRIGVDEDIVKSVSFQFRYLKDALDVFSSKYVFEYLYQGVEKPLVLKDADYTVLLMPTRLAVKIVDVEGNELVDGAGVYSREAVAV